MKFRPWHLGLIALVVVVGMAALVTGGTQPGSIKVDGDIMTKYVSRIDPNASVVFDIALVEGGDAEHESAHIFQALESAPGVATLALDTRKLTLAVAFDASAISEDAIRQQLTASGYLERSLADAVEATVAADGASQTIHLVPGEALEPAFFRAKAGIPLSITFSPGEGHLASVEIPALGLTQDITVEGASISIPAPVAGTYELVCAEGYPDATMVVE